MNLKRTIVFGAAAGGLAALVAGAATSGNRPLERSSFKAPEGVMSGAQLAAEIARLHERLRPTVAPQPNARNLFAFNAARPARALAVPPRPASSESALARSALRPDLKLIGLAEDAGADGQVVRTAILSGFGELFLVKEGELVKDRFRVGKISAEVVELLDVNDNAPLRLALK
jgi:hypothetical protein